MLNNSDNYTQKELEASALLNENILKLIASISNVPFALIASHSLLNYNNRSTIFKRKFEKKNNCK